MFAPSNLIAIMIMHARKKPSVLLQQGYALPPQLLLHRCSLETPASVCVFVRSTEEARLHRLPLPASQLRANPSLPHQIGA